MQRNIVVRIFATAPLAAALVAALVAASAKAGPAAGSLSDPTIYAHHPNSVLALGRGFNPNDTTAPKLPCVVKTEQRLDPGARTTEYRMFLADDDADVEQTTNFDAKASASSLTGASVAATLGFSNTAKYGRSNRRAVIWLYADYGRFALAPPVALTEEAQSLIAEPAKFADRCGTRYVLQETRKSWIAVSIAVDTASTLLSDELRGSLSGSTGAMPLSASGEAAFKRAVNVSNKHGRLQMRLKASGGKGHGGLAQIVETSKASADVIPSLLAALAKFNAEFGADNAVPVEYQVESFENSFFKGVSLLPPWSDDTEKALRTLAQRYRLTEELLGYATQLRDDPNRSPFKAGSMPPDILNEVIARGNADLAALRNAWTSCKLGSPQGYSFDATAKRSEIPACAMPRTSNALAAFDVSRTQAPDIKFMIAYTGVDGKTTSLPDHVVKHIVGLDADRRLEAIRKWTKKPTDHFAIMFQVDGRFLTDETFYYIDENGSETRASQTSDAGWSSIWWASTDATANENDMKGMERRLIRFLRASANDGEGILLRRARTSFGTHFDLPVARVSWNAQTFNFEYLVK